MARPRGSLPCDHTLRHRESCRRCLASCGSPRPHTSRCSVAVRAHLPPYVLPPHVARAQPRAVKCHSHCSARTCQPAVRCLCNPCDYTLSPVRHFMPRAASHVAFTAFLRVPLLRFPRPRSRRMCGAHCAPSCASLSVPGWAYPQSPSRRSTSARIPQFPAKTLRAPFRVVVTLSIVHRVRCACCKAVVVLCCCASLLMRSSASTPRSSGHRHVQPSQKVLRRRAGVHLR